MLQVEPVRLDALVERIQTLHAPDLMRSGQFEVDGVFFHMTRINEKEKTIFHFSAELGYVPFTIESQEKRRVLQNVITAMRPIAPVEFLIDEHHFLRVQTSITDTTGADANAVVHHFLAFYQKARPFISIVGAYL